MTIFADKSRTRRDLMREGEGAFAFFDSCGREPFRIFRSLVNEWASELPPFEQAEIKQRMRKGSDQQFYAALAELMVHAMFVRLGHSVELHPKLDGARHKPDFLVRGADGEVLAYVEVTTFGPSTEEVSKAKRAAEVHAAITKAKLPLGCRVGYSLRAATVHTPRVTSLVADIERWAHDAADGSEQIFHRDGWSVELSLHHGLAAEVPATGVIAGWTGEARWVSGAIEIRDALETKATRYGTLAAPYMVAVVDCKDEIVSDARGELTEALLGDEVVEDHLSASGTVRTYLVRRGGILVQGEEAGAHERQRRSSLAPCRNMGPSRTRMGAVHGPQSLGHTSHSHCPPSSARLCRPRRQVDLR